MKVAHVMAGAPSGGAELFYERLTGALAGAGEDVLAVIRRDAGRAGRLAAAGLAPVQLRFGGPVDVLTGWRLKRVLAEFDPHVVVAWMNRAAKHTPAGPWVLAGRLGGYYDLRYYRRCEHLIGNTAGIAAWIRKQGWDAGRVHHLPNFSPDLAGMAPASDITLPPGARPILAMGRLHKVKGFDVLIRALARLPDVHLLLAGEGVERDNLVELAARENVSARLHLLGWRRDMGALLAASEILVCPSRHEPLGNVVLEAFSANRAVVASAADGPRELIVPGEQGLLVPVGDVEALANGIRLTLDHTAMAQRFAEAGRTLYEAEYAQPRVLARWQEFLHTVRKAG